MPPYARTECRAVQVARAFFHACTKLSDDTEDILPQEDSVDNKLSVFHLFAELFPEFANAGKNGLMRLQFNKIGYEMYEKEQSRRVPAVRAKPGNPGYGFRRARWRNTLYNVEDIRVCEVTFGSIGVSKERIDRIRKRVDEFRQEWDAVRRPSRPAGPGRPRGLKRGIDEGQTRFSPTQSKTERKKKEKKERKRKRRRVGKGRGFLLAETAVLFSFFL